MLNDIPSAPVVTKVLMEDSEGNFVPLGCLSSGSDSQLVELYCNDEREVFITNKKMTQARAVLLLVPVLGLHFLLLPHRPEKGSHMEVFTFTFTTSQSSKGLPHGGFYFSVLPNSPLVNCPTR